MAYGLKLLSAPKDNNGLPLEPISLQDMKTFLRVDNDITLDDPFICSIITASRKYCENWLGSARFIQATYLMTLDRFPSLWWIGSWGNSYQDYQGYQGPSQGAGQGNWQWTLDGKTIRLPKSPLISVNSIQYVDPASPVGGPTLLNTLAPSQYQVVTTKTPGLLSPAYGLPWPISQTTYESVQIQFTAGFGMAMDVPDAIKQAMRLLCGHWYTNRMAVITGTVSKAIEMSVEALLSCEWDGEYIGA